MPSCGERRVEDPDVLDSHEAEVIVLLAYMKLPFLAHGEDGSWVATLRKFENCELRLIEPVTAAAAECVLRVELFDHSTQSVIDGRECKGLQGAARAFVEMMPAAEAYARTLPTPPSSS